VTKPVSFAGLRAGLRNSQATGYRGGQVVDDAALTALLDAHEALRAWGEARRKSCCSRSAAKAKTPEQRRADGDAARRAHNVAAVIADRIAAEVPGG
jgi:hypothetical protein